MALDLRLSSRGQKMLERLKNFIKDEIIPGWVIYKQQHAELKSRWSTPPILDELKDKAKAAGLFNFFLPKDYSESGGWTNLEYSYFAEAMGSVPIASEVFNCSAPDTGNMETIAKYGTDEQKLKYLVPLMEGKIRSCFFMTEPAVASSDATNITTSFRIDGDEIVINGRKWWSSGAMDERCRVGVVMGKHDKNAPKHQQQSMVLVPLPHPGVKILRHLTVFGYDDAPHGHAEVLFENVRVPKSNVLLGFGRGFEIAQGRLGPGRIHHCMRSIGVAERALASMVDRVGHRTAFGKKLAEFGTIQKDIADSRIEIDMNRLLVLTAAAKIDEHGDAKHARKEIAMIKVAVPNMALVVVDRALQAHGGAGVSQDTPLAEMYAHLRTLRLADGPDEVHRRTIARLEFRSASKNVMSDFDKSRSEKVRKELEPWSKL